jgi:diguanylate cyclase (GGDEF)-like protein/PAS domain S-box-containing protein
MDLSLARAILDTTNDAFVSMDADGRITDWNPGAEEMFGLPRQQAVGRVLADTIIPEQHRQAHVVGLERFLRTGAGPVIGRRIELSALRRDGAEFPIELTISALPGARGWSFHAFIQDVSERRQVAQRLRAAERLFRTAFENAPIGMALVALDGTFLEVNGVLCEIIGYDAGALLTRTLHDVTHPADLDADQAQLEQLVAGEIANYAVEKRCIRADGLEVWIELHVSLVRDEDGTPVHVIAQIRDVTEIKRADAVLHGAFEHAPIGVALSLAAGPGAGRLIRVNHALEELLGYEPDALTGRTLASLAHPDDRPRTADALERLRGGVERVRIEQRLSHSEGNDVWALLSSSLVDASDEMAPQVITQILDISERKSFAGRQQQLADSDPLTGLPNRRQFQRELARTLAYAARYGNRGAVLLLDLDGLKRVMGTLGPSLGDTLLLRTGRVLRSALRATDRCGRLGAGEFAVILPEATREQAVAVADKLLTALREEAIAPAADGRSPIVAAIGLTLFEGACGLTSEDVIAEAASALAAVRDAGRGGARVFDADRRGERCAESTNWLERLRAGLDEDRFRLLAQPICAVGARGPAWHELLLRYEDDAGELVVPATFLDAAERIELIVDIDRWVLTQAVATLHAEHAAGRDLRLSVNLSATTLIAGGLGSYVKRLLAGRLVPAGRLVIEIAEADAVVNIECTQALAEQLHEQGCWLALDDFGTGFASLYALKHLDFDVLKIDGELLAHGGDKVDELVLEAVVRIAHGIGAEIVAEAVTDDLTQKRLRQLGVDHAQGYHLGRPQPLASVLDARRGAGGAQ